MESLKLLFDPAAYMYQKGERGAEAELPGEDADGDPPGFTVPPRAEQASVALHRCRVCQLEQGDAAYCPVCLADTMEPA